MIIIDQGSKLLILHNFCLGETRSLLSLLNLNYTRNYGVAFSFFSDGKNWQRWFFIFISTTICMVLSLMIYFSKRSQKLNNTAYSLIIGGSLGNLLDRLWYGFVIDMIDFHIGDWHFATFNLADGAICIGVSLIMLEKFLSK